MQGWIMQSKNNFWNKKTGTVLGVIVTVVLCLCLAAPVIVHADQNVMIRRGDSGHYHSRQCQSGVYANVSLREAQARGLQPCPTCYAKDDTKKDNTKPTGEKKPDKPVVLPTISINKTSILLIKGANTTLTVKNAVTSVSWKSSKSSVATVSNGKVRAKKAGTATISVTANGQTRTCEVTVEAPKISKTSVIIAKGTTTTLKLKGCAHKIKWSSSNKKIATVKDGVVTGKSKGTVKVSAKCHNKSYTCKVKVEAPEIVKPDAELYPGETMNLTFKGCAHKYKWSSLNEDIATVSSNGTVTGRSAGTTTIQVDAHGKIYKCSVTVEKPEITMDKTELKLEMTRDKETLQVNYRGFLPGDSKAITWVSEDTSVVKVDANGLVEPVNIGSTFVRATCGDLVAYRTVKVIPRKDITLNKTYTTIYVDNTDTLSVAKFANFEDSDSRTAAWKTSDSSIATISNTGMITAKKVGTCTITATVGRSTAECKVNVIPKSITLNTSSLMLAEKEYSTLTVSYNGFTSSDSRSVTWKSSNTSVATVSGGRVTAQRKGTATITATCGSYTATCYVTVVQKSIILSSSNLALYVGRSSKLDVTYDNFSTSDSRATKWTSSYARVATVSADGTVTAAAPGKTTITATCGSYTATCIVTVSDVPQVSAVYVSGSNTVMKDATIVLTATIQPAEASYKNVTWTTNDSTIVDFNGQNSAAGSLTVQIRGMKAGTTDITVTVDGQSATCTVTVTVPQTDPAAAQEPQA